jgi:hypothetical protein
MLMAWLGNVDWPKDPVGWSALALAGLALAIAFGSRRWRGSILQRIPAWAGVGLLATLSSLLSAGYVAYYLRGGPRIIDATSYFLEARTFAQGLWAFPVVDPSASFRGRFLLATSEARELGVIFPPGYPALLALGVLLGFPMAVGPLLAGLVAALTYALGRELSGLHKVGLLAGALSVVSAALRYHTADTMAHGWSALLVTLALWSGFRHSRWGLVVAGLASGWLCATRPVTGLVVVLVCGGLAWRRARLGEFLLALLPGLSLLSIHQHALTGSWLGSSQFNYYALADGPPGCFRYGFGVGTGCMNEHGDFVRALLPTGFGAHQAAVVTWRRVYSHLRDAFNFQLWGLLLLPPSVILGWVDHRLRGAVMVVLGVVLAYVPFYFDGSYPGGGARLYADILPLEHVLAACVLWRARVAHWALPLALAGFALQTGADQRALQKREGGRPMFEPEVLARAGIRSGLVFIGTDHGFNLAHRPAELDAGSGLVVARERGDAYDRALWEKLGRPPSYRYRYDPATEGSEPVVMPYEPRRSVAPRFEAESAWPPLEVRGGWLKLAFLDQQCVSKGRGLTLLSVDSPIVTTAVDVSVPVRGSYVITLGWADAPGADIEAELGGVRWGASVPEAARACWPMPSRVVLLQGGTHVLTVSSRAVRATLDYVDIRPANPRVASPL